MTRPLLLGFWFFATGRSRTGEEARERAKPVPSRTESLCQILRVFRVRSTICEPIHKYFGGWLPLLQSKYRRYPRLCALLLFLSLRPVEQAAANQQHLLTHAAAFRYHGSFGAAVFLPWGFLVLAAQIACQHGRTSFLINRSARAAHTAVGAVAVVAERRYLACMKLAKLHSSTFLSLVCSYQKRHRESVQHTRCLAT